MRVDVVWWDLARSHQTIESLERDLRDSVEPWHEVRGLRLKLWIADRERGRWGAVMWWDSDVPADQPLPPNRAAELIGYAPDHRSAFDVAAVAEGIDALGLAFSAEPSTTSAHVTELR
ncbi:hypothetical protein DWB77_04283 [Streptomyces hundungensis]|uniref:Uncharacterized protein n=1 Tax=Streptomyces hundungensis TaxID=1077946 RepID=A0A387HIN6_9ACTN|nr:hypothetical protein [Streptomyces hundungensis]AYG82113.1 hypothetical protein DWB77_04283 [Streptomyces hundungensis]